MCLVLFQSLLTSSKTIPELDPLKKYDAARQNFCTTLVNYEHNSFANAFQIDLLGKIRISMPVSKHS